MKHTEEKVREIATKVFQDIGYPYFIEDSLDVRELTDRSQLRENIEKAWKDFAKVPHEQFPGAEGIISLLIDDETLNPVAFFDGSGGRIPLLKIVKKEGKYIIDGQWDHT